jgi:hypothetical protein
MGVGDRFGRQGEAQLAALQQAAARGVTITPVWNKSHREHGIIGTRPQCVREEADAAVRARGWTGAYFVDADHIGPANVDAFLQPCDFFTLDVAEAIGRPAGDGAADAFLGAHPDLVGELAIEGLPEPLSVTEDDVRRTVGAYRNAAREAGDLYRRIAAARGADTFVTEVSMDETATPQSPAELLLILAMLADEAVPVRTLAPRFSGRFNKGVDYVGDPDRFGREFEADACVIRFAVKRFGLPAGLKLSVHSGSDKFALYPRIRETLARLGAGVHIKTAGTTWLEELVGLALGGEEGLAIAREVYRGAYERFDELCKPYAEVIDIDRARLPAPAEVAGWNGETYAAALRHEPDNAAFNPHLRQLLHVGYKVAAEMGARYLRALETCEQSIARNVSFNIYERHAARIFPGVGDGDAAG